MCSVCLYHCRVRLSADGGWQRKAEVVDVRNRSSVGVQCEKQCRRSTQSTASMTVACKDRQLQTGHSQHNVTTVT